MLFLTACQETWTSTRGCSLRLASPERFIHFIDTRLVAGTGDAACFVSPSMTRPFGDHRQSSWRAPTAARPGFGAEELQASRAGI
jgi:hypothetical protein